MTFEEYWQQLMKTKPIADNQKVLMSKEQFKNMQLKAFKKGFFSCLNKGKPIQNKNPFDCIFDDIDKIIKDIFGGL